MAFYNLVQTNLEEKNTKPFYRYIKAQKNDNFGISSLKFNGLMYSDSSSKSEILNKQFQSVFTKKSTTATPRLLGNKYPSIGNLSITLKGVQKLLENNNISKAAGPDLIPGRMLNMLAPELVPIVHAIFTQNLDTGELPRHWSLANVAPIFKKGNRVLAKNYRPFSLTFVLPVNFLNTLFAGTFWTMLRTTKFSPTSNMVFDQAEVVRHN